MAEIQEFFLNVLSDFKPFGAGTNVMDLEDFIVSNLLLPIGALVFILFCVNKRYGWGWDNFTKEANTGEGMKFPTSKAFKFYLTFVLPIVMLYITIQAYVTMF